LESGETPVKAVRFSINCQGCLRAYDGVFLSSCHCETWFSALKTQHLSCNTHELASLSAVAVPRRTRTVLSQAVRSLLRLQCRCNIRNEQTACRILSTPPSFCLFFIFLWHSIFLSYISYLFIFYISFSFPVSIPRLVFPLFVVSVSYFLIIFLFNFLTREASTTSPSLKWQSNYLNVHCS